ncbi:Hsp20/alpha crystallin family protein [Arcticibacter sp.]|jgi:HSP20 family protein|uniref:Hsp20/alpha crystallin family protein n=1 Tax=Arcticibacter sp. TaxID=1872630 RepID=UPI0038900627
MEKLIKSTRIPSLRRLFENFGASDSFFDGPLFNREIQVPAVNIKENKKSFEIEVAAPGFEKEDFKLYVANNIITITAEHKKEEQDEKDGYIRKEFSSEAFTRSFSLPDNVSEEKIKAKYDKGMLRLKLEKSYTTEPERKSIAVH